MKPFDLEAAKAGEPIVCRDGRPAKFIAHVPEACPACRVVVLAGDFVIAKAVDGRRWPDLNGDTDIFMAPKRRTVWLNLYPAEYRSASYHATEEAADKHAADAATNRLGGKAWPLEVEE